MLRSVTTALLLAVVWLLWSGHLEPIVLVFGAVSCVLVAATIRRFGMLEERQPYELIARMVLYSPWMLWQILAANIRVSKLILNPKMPISPRLVRHVANQETVLGQVLHANTITITPGTISLDLRDNTLLVHALTAEDADDEAEREVDRMISWVEGTITMVKEARERASLPDADELSEEQE